ncbi:MAG: BTAD domain-containing putative transcriptional regulator, partial [Actinomycetota bacterium]
MEFEVRLLGRFSVRRRGQEIPPASYEGRLVRTLIRVLAARPATFVSRDFLVEALWPDRTPADPERNLNVMVARARRALEDPSLILTEPGGYCFDPDGRCWIDSLEFVRLVQSGRSFASSSLPADALKEFSEALALWRGEPLSEDALQDWAHEYRAGLFRLQQEALEGGARAALASHDPSGAALLAEQAAAQEPLKEAPHLILAEALYAAGDHAGALDVIAGFKSRLADLLGLDSSGAMGELEFMILNGALPRRSQARTPASRAIPFGSLPFVGRQAVLDCILGLLDGPETTIATLEGPSGSGKSRLFEEIKRNQSKPIAEAAAFLAEREEPWALARSLIREMLSIYPDAAASLSDRTAEALAGVVPELADLTPSADASTDPESRRALALEGAFGLVRTAVADGLPVLIDDLQWADPTSLLLLSQLRRRVPGIKMVLAYRPEEVLPDGPVARFLEAQDSRHISLGPLSSEAISQLVSDEDLRRVMVEQTDRSPLAVTELARSLARSGAIALDGAGRWASRNPALGLIAREQARTGQARAYVARINRLAPPARQLMRTLALLGRPASARLLAAAVASTQLETLEALEALSRAGLVRLAEMGWDTAHDLIADAVSEALEREEKARLHALLAEALRVEGADVWERARHL